LVQWLGYGLDNQGMSIQFLAEARGFP
jgi:hypothetical protein